MLGRVIGPEHIGEHHLRVGGLPQEKIGQPHFAAGADEEIERGKIGGVEMARNARLADFALLSGERCGARNFLLRSVIERDGKNALAARGTLDRVLDRSSCPILALQEGA